MNKTKRKQTLDFTDILLMRYAPDYNVNKKLLDEAFSYFEYFFEINEMTSTYCCGTLHRLEKIIGDDYFSSNLLVEIADTFAEKYFPVLKDNVELAWKKSIIKVIGEEAWEEAFTNCCTEKIEEEIINFINTSNEYFTFNSKGYKKNKILELINTNPCIHRAVCYSIADFLENKGLDVIEVLTSNHLLNKYYGYIFSIVDIICYDWYYFTEILKMESCRYPLL